MKKITEFEEQYDSSQQDRALYTRGRFLQEFPLHSLRGLSRRRYVMGRHEHTFCYYVEAFTKPWASIPGGTSYKFGIYFGKTNRDSTQLYRFRRRFGANSNAAFAGVKAALLELVALGAERKPDFAAIDRNLLSQMFKAKILSLYFPERFIPICSAEHLELLGEELGFGSGLPSSMYQNLLLKAKRRNPVTAKWSTPKFMDYLYRVYVRDDLSTRLRHRRPRKVSHRRVNFEDIQKQRIEIGRKAEEFAIAWERIRLMGAGLAHLIPTIEDRRDRPGFGHDFLSFEKRGVYRYIEVKTVAKAGGDHRFFLSENEYTVSLSREHKRGYYFYLVFIGVDGRPADLCAIQAGKLYRRTEMNPSSFVVLFNRESLTTPD